MEAVIPVPANLLIRRKITAVFADGSSKMNLGIAMVTEMLRGARNVPVTVADDKGAQELLAELAASSGRTVETASAGTLFLAPPAPPLVQTVSEPVGETVLPDKTALPRRTRGDVGKRGEVIYRPYQTLGTTFFQGSPEGQLQSVYKARESNPQKLADYRAAVAKGDCVLPTTRKSKALLRKLAELGFDQQLGG